MPPKTVAKVIVVACATALLIVLAYSQKRTSTPSAVPLPPPVHYAVPTPPLHPIFNSLPSPGAPFPLRFVEYQELRAKNSTYFALGDRPRGLKVTTPPIKNNEEKPTSRDNGHPSHILEKSYTWTNWAMAIIVLLSFTGMALLLCKSYQAHAKTRREFEEYRQQNARAHPQEPFQITHQPPTGSLPLYHPSFKPDSPHSWDFADAPFEDESASAWQSD